MPTPALQKRHVDLAVGPTFRIDQQTGDLLDVALLTVGEAKGHGFYIDSKTIATANEAIKANGGRLRAYPSHEHSGCTHWWGGDEADEVGAELNMAGFVQEITATDTQLIGGRLAFYDAFKKNWPAIYAQIAELAAKTPDLCGLSLEPVFHVVWIGTDGTEYSAPPENVDLLYNGLPVARIDELYAVAFGAVPAANKGLFAALTKLFGGNLKNKTVLQRLAQAFSDGEAETASAGELTALPAADSAQAASGRVPLPGLNKNTATTESTSTSSMNKLIAELRAKYGSDEKKFGQAMLIVGQSSTTDNLTLDQIEAKLTQADLTAFRTQVADLTAQLATANKAATDLKTSTDKTIADLTKERDDLKKQFEAIKNSGLPGQVDLGVTSTGAGAENPWAKETLNLTRQAELTATQPALAAQLKAAAAKK